MSNSKKVKPLGISSKDRSRHLPNVPTISETLPTPFVATYNGILAPKETPREIVAADLQGDCGCRENSGVLR